MIKVSIEDVEISEAYKTAGHVHRTDAGFAIDDVVKCECCFVTRISQYALASSERRSRGYRVCRAGDLRTFRILPRSCKNFDDLRELLAYSGLPYGVKSAAGMPAISGD
jgi:hypothetical protein